MDRITHRYFAVNNLDAGRKTLLLTFLTLLMAALCAVADLESDLAGLKAEDTKWPDRRKFAEKVALHGNRAIEPLKELLMSDVRNVHLAARLALVKIGPEAVPVIQDLLKTGAEKNKIKAVKALGDFGKHAMCAVPDLDKLSKSSSTRMKSIARSALIDIGRDFDIQEDEIIMKEGTVCRGVIINESAHNVKMAVIRHFQQRTSVMDRLIPVSMIKTKQLADPKFKPILQARLEAYWDAKKGTASRVACFACDEEKRGSDTVRIIETDHFLIETTASRQFAIEAALKLDAMANAYEEHFKTVVAPGPQVHVIIARNKAEYQAIQQKCLGKVILNPAFYAPELNLILGYSDLDEWRKVYDKVKSENAAYQIQIRQVKKEIENYETKLRTEVANIRNNIRKQVKAQGNSKAARQWGYEQDEKVKKQQAEIQKAIKASHEQLKKYSTEISANQRKNRRIMDLITRDMFHTLAHEAFHAFFRNRIKKPEHATVNTRWLNEGLAMYFESALFDGVDLLAGVPNKLWISHLQSSQKKAGLVDLETLLKGSGKDFIVHSREQTERSNTFYFQSWYLVRYLIENGRLRDPAVMTDYVSNVAEGKDAVKAFCDLTGMELVPCWEQYNVYLENDDFARYSWLNFTRGSGPNGKDSVLGRVIARTPNSVKVRMRDGSLHNINKDLFLDEMR
jgi:hypothetical protein